jgi:hypothetical protein
MKTVLRGKDRVMLTIRANTETGTYTWNIGERRPCSFPEAVVKIEASGPELDLIKREFTNIPMFEGKCVIWTGDMSRFIYDNLCR